MTYDQNKNKKTYDNHKRLYHYMLYSLHYLHLNINIVTHNSTTCPVPSFEDVGDCLDW